MSSQQLLFDKIDGDTCRSRTLPSTYAKGRELRRLKSLLRRSGRALNSGPDISHPQNIVSQAFQSLGIRRPRLKTSLLAAADMKSSRGAMWLTSTLSAIVNRLGGDFRFQHLPVPYEVYADGIDLVVFEEFGSGAAALHLRDELEPTNCCATRNTGGGSARTTTTSTVHGPGTATSSTRKSCPVPTSRWG
jgi:N-acyl-D-aspartate/D-glutamate deacylase